MQILIDKTSGGHTLIVEKGDKPVTHGRGLKTRSIPSYSRKDGDGF